EGMKNHIIEFEDVKAETTKTHFASSSSQNKVMKVIVLLSANTVLYEIYHEGKVVTQTGDFKTAIEEYNKIQ
ncbi:hypothetical protein KAR91_46700, partial [Candidatus Pacearchaeota archaeon]|nr:hypothetical protein [Candidatus Pacearchaeota archaeon]